MHTWMAGRRIQRGDRTVSTVRGAGGPEARSAEIVWQFAGEMQSMHWRPAHLVLAGRGNEIYAFDGEMLDLKFYLDTGFGFQRFLTPPGQDRLIVLGANGVCVFDAAMKMLWEVDGLRSEESLEFDGFHELRFTLKAKQRPADEPVTLEFDVETGPVARRKKSGPGAQATK